MQKKARLNTPVVIFDAPNERACLSESDIGVGCRRVALGDQDGAVLSRTGNGRRHHVARRLGALWKSCHEGRPRRSSFVQDKWWDVCTSPVSSRLGLALHTEVEDTLIRCPRQGQYCP